jgi:hypothetical protein
MNFSNDLFTFDDSPELDKVEKELEDVAEEEDQHDGGEHSRHHHFPLLPTFKGIVSRYFSFLFYFIA